MRLPLPIRLNHINIYLFEDEDGWTVFDTGMDSEGCRAGWRKALTGILSKRPITRIICSHFHLDHVGLAGWLYDQFAPTFCMTKKDHQRARVLISDVNRKSIKAEARFFEEHGLPRETSEAAVLIRMERRAIQSQVPSKVTLLKSGMAIRLAGREWKVLTGAGHSLEQIMLFSPADNIFVAADQVLPEITPNISVEPWLPDADPLGDFLTSLEGLRSEVPNDAFVLPGHRRPFIGLHDRIDYLQEHHAVRCQTVVDACRIEPTNTFDLIPVLFGRSLDSEVILTALGEAIAHTSYLCKSGRLERQKKGDGRYYYSVNS